MDNKDLKKLKTVILYMANGKKTKDIIEEKVCKIIDKYPSICEYQVDLNTLDLQEKGLNLGMIAGDWGYEKIAIKTLQNKLASVQQDINGMNIGMFCAKNKLEKATLISLDNPKASIQQDSFGNNIGMYSANSKMEIPTIKAMHNPVANNQLNKNNKTISIIFAQYQITNIKNNGLNK